MADDGSARLAELWCMAKKSRDPMIRRAVGFIETVHSIHLTHKASIVRCAVAIMGRSLMMSRLAPLIVLMLCFLAVAAPQAQVADKAPDAPAHSSSECISRLTNFVEALDDLLESNPPTLFPLDDLLKKYFPLERCDVEEAVKISHRSKFFSR
jgi:hypothetical protein